MPAPRPPPSSNDDFDIVASPDPLPSMYGRFQTLGDIYQSYSPSRKRPSVVVSHPDWVRHILIDNRANYRKGVGFERVKMLLGNGIIVSDGEHWKRHRLMVQPAFQKALIARYADEIGLINQRALVEWKSAAGAGRTINVTQCTSEIALESVLRSIFSEDVEGFGGPLASNPLMLPAHDPSRDLKFVVNFRSVVQLMREIVAFRRQDRPTRTDILAVLLDARDRTTGEPMDDRALLDELKTLVIAGHETTAATLNWCWYLLGEHPQVETRLLQSLLDAELSGGPTAKDLPRLAYTRQVLEETMRLYPPVWRFTRIAEQADRLGDFGIPAGADIFICPYLVHRHPRYWDDVERFEPARFDPAAVERRPRFAYLPFSAGPRRCIGDYLALVEMQLHLATLVPVMSLLRTSPSPQMEPEINLRTRGDVLMRPTLRST